MNACAEMTGTEALGGVERRSSSVWIDGVVAMTVLVALGLGWQHRGDAVFDPRGWPGYLLGLCGSLAMLLVLCFSIRKRLGAVTRARRSVGWWYNAHILLGLAGPLAVLCHARFAWGSINSSFALGATLLVVASGVSGRYLLGAGRRLRARMAGALAVAEADLAAAGEGSEMRLARRRRNAARRAAGIAAALDRAGEVWHYAHIPLFMVLVPAVLLHVYMAHAY
ncbi:FAD-dependent pyridine nucleotide-disulfide oxidoreductase [Novosphingobium nitrogenifigens DSM 19370]|uniref:FAD-dependent pyridine nucleotide-disulfide oxidoreductase n=2 Tax=Novosphingobium nitrogenifigens TaxID=378548 RepID=F1ZBT0_9SPHN|nr:FAD-dependent pyridine nucleotide-disulfide oxidoreductase [Novosphingobium nitrogenifigens DSM 19370]